MEVIRRYFPQKPWQLVFMASFLCGGVIMANGLYIKAKAQLAQLMIAHAWEKQKQTGENQAPWPWADTYPIAKIALKNNKPQWVLSGANMRNLAFGPTLQMQTALPGRRGNVVIYGHNDTHFSGLSEIKPGDTMSIETRAGTQVYYSVEEISIAHESDTQWIEQTDDDRVTLVTCYPFDAMTFNGPLRYVVVAKPQLTPDSLRDFAPDVFYSAKTETEQWL
ncbi:class GN sortase [Grimontia sp. NTOU-MAR1]|uniref:class GN sortase n=1 Tax=Grimontia sp. NTOU-MAR1 TaxID=3111011 RepID=UPI002DB74A0F|nr:class GN sortase [Grimontia sp. NTOU-MAR1]WRV98282.1 class GN sortase [Grimontia sp. NTOU-MAR1]